MKTKEQFKNARSVHFVGIGGIGTSAVARMMKMEGKKVSGSDRGASEVTSELEKAGVSVSVGHSASNIPIDCDLIVHSVAISEDNPELKEARSRNIPILTYPQTLRFISEEKNTIAISGTHGKTTITAMVGCILMEAGLDPTVLVGSLMPLPHDRETRVNFVLGKGNHFVVEADEYKKSFHNLSPKILVINNLDVDHLDFYKDLADIQASFRVVAERVPEDGFVICDIRDSHVQPVVVGLKATVVDYSQFLSVPLKLKIPGLCNRQNAAAALAVAQSLGIEESVAVASLNAFTGVWRRFEYHGTTKDGGQVYDDYAHNPQKVRAALQGIRELYPDKKITVIFQPHLYSRTKLLLSEFAGSFADADQVLLPPIYAAREALDPSITSEMLAEEIIKRGREAIAFSDLSTLDTFVFSQKYGPETAVVTVGAGDIYLLAKRLGNI